jgi:hypothetical protein
MFGMAAAVALFQAYKELGMDHDPTDVELPLNVILQGILVPFDVCVSLSLLGSFVTTFYDLE